jgi:hypothetical protein
VRLKAAKIQLVEISDTVHCLDAQAGKSNPSLINDVSTVHLKAQVTRCYFGDQDPGTTRAEIETGIREVGGWFGSSSVGEGLVLADRRG